jgi:hypothetical protein
MAGRRWNVAGFCLAVPVLFKVYPLAIVLLFFLIHPLRLGWRTALCVLGGLALPLVLQNPAYVTQVYQSWVDQVANDNRRALPLHDSYRECHTLLRSLGIALDDGTYTVLQLAMALLVAAVVMRGHWQGWPQAQHLRAAFDLGCCWIILFGPATENSTYTLLAPTLALATWEAFQAGQPLWKRRAILVMVSLFAATAVATTTPLGRHCSYFLMPLGALMLFAERLAWVGHRTGRLALAPQSVQSPTVAQAA